MKITPRDDFSAVLRGKNEWIIYCRVDFNLKHAAAMGQSITNRAMHLGHAAEGIGILHAFAINVRLPQLAAREKAAEISRGLQLAGMWPRSMNAFIESDVSAQKGIERKRADNICRVGENLGRASCQSSNRQHGLCAVDERDGFFRFKYQWLQAGFAQRIRCGKALTFVNRLAFSDNSQRQMGQRSEIAAGAHTALRRNHRMHSAIEHRAERLDHNRAHTAIALGERIGAQQHHGASPWLTQWLTDTGRMRAHQVDLQFTDLIRANAHITQLPNARVDGISDAVTFKQ